MTTKQSIIVAALVLAMVGIIGARVFVRKKGALAARDPNTLMSGLADEAVAVAASRGVLLDYTPDSVERVESILAVLHQSRRKGEFVDRDVNAHAHRFGAYIGEVLRRKYDGHWEADHDVAGPKTYPVHWKGHQSFPVGWCGKRILNGEEDNVWFKFETLISEQFLRETTQPNEVGPPNG